ncbi:MAG: hypothetical protein AABX03_00705 [Nanoarchaeota archaeon]
MKTERKNNFVVGEKKKVELYPGHVKLDTEYLGRDGDSEVFKVVNKDEYVLMNIGRLTVEQDDLVTYKSGSKEQVRVISERFRAIFLPNLNKLLQLV